jgi:hypothetical protein
LVLSDKKNESLLRFEGISVISLSIREEIDQQDPITALDLRANRLARALWVIASANLASPLSGIASVIRFSVTISRNHVMSMGTASSLA